MKTKTKAVIVALAVGASAWIIVAQDGGREGPPPGSGPGPRRMLPVPLVIRALDANHDGVVDADEIGNASAVLKSLDKNGDGKLTMDELMGPPPPRDGGPGPGTDLPPGPPRAAQ